MRRHVLVTGGLGFIGRHLVEALIACGDDVTILDSNTPRSVDGAITCYGDIRYRFDLADVDVVVHLAALAGVRPSISEPVRYTDVNVNGTAQVLEFARRAGVKQFVFASSSSVYGNPDIVRPVKESDALRPISPYGATKAAGEHLGRVYSDLHGIRFVALRFFTVYGPRQRPDLAIHTFASKMLAGEPITVYGDGSSRRDYTYVSDTVAGILAAIDYRDSMFEAFNIGSGNPITLSSMVAELEAALGVRATVEHWGDQPGDVAQTWADTSKASKLLEYRPRVSFVEGIARYAKWLQQAIAVGVVR